MPRFYFQLEGAERVADNYGRRFEDPVEAFRAANRLAREISEVRPNLRGNTCVVMKEQDHPDDLYCISI